MRSVKRELRKQRSLREVPLAKHTDTIQQVIQLQSQLETLSIFRAQIREFTWRRVHLVDKNVTLAKEILELDAGLREKGTNASDEILLSTIRAMEKLADICVDQDQTGQSAQLRQELRRRLGAAETNADRSDAVGMDSADRAREHQEALRPLILPPPPSYDEAMAYEK